MGNVHRNGNGRRRVRSGQQIDARRWELEPLFLPDALRRFHERKSLLLVRGQFGAVLDKAHFFTEKAFKARTGATNAFKSHLHIPTVNVSAAGAAAQPQAVAASVEVSRGNTAPQNPATSKHESSRARVLRAASAIFVDTKRFEAAFLLAMNHASNQEIAVFAASCGKRRVVWRSPPASKRALCRDKAQRCGSADANVAGRNYGRASGVE